MQTIKPASNQLFCKQVVGEKQTKSGILIPDSAVEKPKTAKVINVGGSVEGFYQKDTIIYKPYTTTDIKLGEDEFFLIAEEDVLGTVVETKE